MKLALELFNSKSYLKAEKEFLACKSEDELQAAQYLFLISKNLKKYDLSDRFNDYLSQLSIKARPSEFLELIQNNTLPINAKNWSYLLEASWGCGKLELFDSWVQKIWKKVIEEKLYNKGYEIFNAVKDRRPFELFNYFCELTRLVEINDQASQAVLVSDILEICTSKKIQFKNKSINIVEYLNRLEDILSANHQKSIEVEKQLLKLKRLKALKTSTKLTNRFVMEYIIIFKDSFSDLSELLEGDMLTDRKDFKDCLFSVSEGGVKIKMLPPRLRSLFAEQRVHEELKPTAVEGKMDSLGPIVKAVSQKAISIDHVVTEEENAFILRIKAVEDTIFENPNEFVQSLCGIGFFKAAYELLARITVGSELYYLKCHVLNELGLYFELKDYAREVLETANLTAEEKVPFSYLLGKSCLEIGEKEQAQRALSQVIGSDPDFRDVRELMARAQA